MRRSSFPTARNGAEIILRIMGSFSGNACRKGDVTAALLDALKPRGGYRPLTGRIKFRSIHVSTRVIHNFKCALG
jgi:hypothetical protein